MTVTVGTNVERSVDSTRVAVSYVRVSTRDQASRGGQEEGFSIPAQRLANARKASAMGATIVEEFVDAGESARKTDRPQLQAMLEYVAANHVDYCIVHKVDRLARNRVDDVEINVALTRAGVRLISATENIDETPSGMLLHGIMSTIAEFYSRNLAAEVSKGMTQKAVSGGTLSRAPIGYRNVRRLDSVGREYRTIEVDDERAPLVRWAFETYAGGDWSLSMLQEELTARGLRTRPTPKIPAKPIEINNLHKMLRNRYYIGDVTYRGVQYLGTHEQIVSRAVWDRVQQVLSAHNTAGDRQRAHEHYLKGTVYCGTCGSRLMLTMAKNHRGVVYDYFVCIGRHRKRTSCQRKSMRISVVERAVERSWGRLRISYDERIEATRIIKEQLATLASSEIRDRDEFEAQRDALMSERSKLLAAHYADAIPLDLMKVEQERIAQSLAIIEERLSTYAVDQHQLERNIEAILHLLQDCDEAYARATPQVRRLMNQAVAVKIFIDEDEDDGDTTVELEKAIEMVRAVARPTLASDQQPTEEEPPSAFVPANRNPRSHLAPGISVSRSTPRPFRLGLNKAPWVDPRRFELLTSSMRTRRATNCAKGPCAAEATQTRI